MTKYSQNQSRIETELIKKDDYFLANRTQNNSASCEIENIKWFCTRFESSWRAGFWLDSTWLDDLAWLGNFSWLDSIEFSRLDSIADMTRLQKIKRVKTALKRYFFLQIIALKRFLWYKHFISFNVFCKLSPIYKHSKFQNGFQF